MGVPQRYWEEAFSPPKRKRLPEMVASQIKDLILQNEIKENEKLPPERTLADLFKVSRVVVRQALAHLEQSGFVKIRPGPKGGAFVSLRLHKPLADLMSDLFREGSLTLHHFSEVRKAIESCVIREVVLKAEKADIKRLEEIHERMAEHLDDPARLREFNTSFHVALADISGNPLAKSIIWSIFELLETLWDTHHPGKNQDPDFIRQTHARHGRIIEALKARDLPLCEELISRDAEVTRELRS
ncbi:MAG: FadR family transcriptional regulator [Deltaproteobacteria bacterium]|nr:FadR family transcriptional regulator [Deltaproteobacteria bacterium]MBW2016882.1 FadR family transcriptional regulator [Deltaproteobacteria bacterium]MBW2128130.1 FadR family transcriptional regulator [Deltaproteobacteria bacterium]MBW2304577.1 FadR family transcriptional regulator [Deltaproteobacteria bacterium]